MELRGGLVRTQETTNAGKLASVFCALHVPSNIGDGAMKELTKETNGEEQYLLELCKAVQKEFFDRLIELVEKEVKRKEK